MLPYSSFEQYCSKATFQPLAFTRSSRDSSLCSKNGILVTVNPKMLILLNLLWRPTPKEYFCDTFLVFLEFNRYYHYKLSLQGKDPCKESLMFHGKNYRNNRLGITWWWIRVCFESTVLGCSQEHGNIYKKKS